MPLFADSGRYSFHPGKLPAPGRVHLWLVALDSHASEVRHFISRLSADEQIRAARFHFPLHRNRWVVSRYAVRQILAGYAGSSPESLTFRVGEYGKPKLASASRAFRLHFNLAHSREQALLAVAREEVGIDIEYIDPELPWQSLAPQVFSRREYELLMDYPVELRRRLFFRIWTCKEAYVKARGQGLSMPLDAFSVPVNDGEEIGIVSVDPAWNDGNAWHLYRVPAANSYAATLACTKHGIRRLGFEWNPSDLAFSP